MRDDGGYTAEDWATIDGAGGASPVASYLSTHYRRARLRPYPSADFAWLWGSPVWCSSCPCCSA